MNKALVWLITLLFLIFSATPNRVLAHPPYISPKTSKFITLTNYMNFLLLTNIHN